MQNVICWQNTHTNSWDVITEFLQMSINFTGI